jgi:hypothetical protein
MQHKFNLLCVLLPPIPALLLVEHWDKNADAEHLAPKKNPK